MTEIDSLFRSPVRRLAQHLYEGTVSACSLLDHYLARIERLNGSRVGLGPASKAGRSLRG
jgi:hypothetical protein